MGESWDLILSWWCILRTVFYGDTGDNFYSYEYLNSRGWSNLAIYSKVFLNTCLAYCWISLLSITSERIKLLNLS